MRNIGYRPFGQQFYKPSHLLFRSDIRQPHPHKFLTGEAVGTDGSPVDIQKAEGLLVIYPLRYRTEIEQVSIFLPLQLQLFHRPYPHRDVLKIYRKSLARRKCSHFEPAIPSRKVFFKPDGNVLLHRSVVFGMELQRHRILVNFP
ncbi:hypothetical protein D3C85_1045930 [compost metagenome]